MAARRSSRAESGATVNTVYAALRVPIVDGIIPPGERINIDAVARDLGVSQTPVREALQRLEGDDLVVYTPGRGYRTTAMLDLTGLRSLFEFRLLVEPWAARSAATHRLSNPAAALTAELDWFRTVVARGGDIRQDMLAHDTRFHDLVFAATGNEIVRQAFAQTHCHLHLFRLYPVDVDGNITLAEHGRLLDAIENRDPVLAEGMMSEHIANSFARSADAFDGPVAPIGAPDAHATP